VISEKRPALLESCGASAVGEEAIAADADEVAGQDVLEETAHEFVCAELQCSVLVAIGVVLPGEADGLRSHVDEAVVGDGDTVRIASEILECCAGPPKGGLA
jgi:hypothetical protein